MERSGIPATIIVGVGGKKQKRWDYAALHPSLQRGKRSKRSLDKRSAVREQNLPTRSASGVITSEAKQSRKCAQWKNRWIASLRSQ